MLQPDTASVMLSNTNFHHLIFIIKFSDIIMLQ